MRTPDRYRFTRTRSDFIASGKPASILASKENNTWAT
jgi:hypothetical protein